VAPILAAVLVAQVAPPRERARPHGGVHWWPAAVGAFLFEFALYNPPIDSQPWAVTFGPWLWVLSRTVLLAVIIRNLVPRISPALVAAVGLSLNTVVIALNGGYMPQSVEAATEVWGSVPHAEARLYNTTPLVADTRLPWLADVIVQPDWLPRRNVMSVGDVLLSLGMAGWTFQLLRRERQPQLALRSS
jgi:hypothetical protein